MRKSFILSLLFIGALAVFFFSEWGEWKAGKSLRLVENVSRTEDLDEFLRRNSEADEESKVSLALHTVHITHGEEGRRQWDLDAAWAMLSRNRGVISFEKPDMLYHLDPDPEGNEDRVHVTADRGEVTDSNSKLRLDGDVRAVRADSSVTGNVMRYDSKTRIVTFTENAGLETPGMSVNADTLDWELATNTMNGDGNIRLLWYPGETPNKTEGKK